MPLQFEIEERIGVVVTTAVGDVTADDLFDHARALASTPDRPRRELVDLSDAASVQVPLAAVRGIAQYLRERDSDAYGGRLALVGRTDEVFATLRVFEAYRSHQALVIRVFRDLEEALCWLGVDEECRRSLAASGRSR